MKSWDWTLSKSNRRALENELAQTKDAETFRRLLALLELDQGRTVAEIARLLRVDRCTVYRWGERFAAEASPAALERLSGQGRPSLWKEELTDLVERALEQPPFKLGYPANTWTFPLLRAYLQFCLPGQEVSLPTVKRHVKALGYSWKRFRHGLPPDPETEKKTPALASDPSLVSVHSLIGPG